MHQDEKVLEFEAKNKYFTGLPILHISFVIENVTNSRSHCLQTFR